MLRKYRISYCCIGDTPLAPAAWAASVEAVIVVFHMTVFPILQFTILTHVFINKLHGIRVGSSLR